MPVIEEVVDDAVPGTAGPGPSSSQPGGDATNTANRGSAVNRLMTHMISSKIETALWLTRLFTVYSTINFFLPIFGGHPYSSYQKALLSNAATSALRLHQRVPHFQLSREYLGRLFMEDSAHYLFYSLIFVTGQPVSMALLPLFLYAVLHAQNYTKQLLNQVGPTSLQFIRNLLSKLEVQQVNILRFIALNEIFLMPAMVFMIFTGQGSIIMPFLYYRFLSLRYGSTRNPYCRQLFHELRVGVESMCSHQQCPQFVRNLALKSVDLVCRLSPAAH